MLYVIAADDDFGFKEGVAAVLADAGLTVEDLEVADVPRVGGQAALEKLTMPTLAFGSRVIYLRGLDDWRAPEVSAAAAVLANAPSDTAYIVRAPWPFPSKSWEALAATGKLLRQTFDGKNLASWVKERTAQLGLALTATQSQQLAERVGADRLLLDSELRKLALATAWLPTTSSTLWWSTTASVGCTSWSIASGKATLARLWTAFRSCCRRESTLWRSLPPCTPTGAACCWSPTPVDAGCHLPR